jgi:hypothetical protein
LPWNCQNCPFDQQREALYYIGERLPRLSAGKLDARGNGQYLAEKAVQKWGAGRIEAVMLSLAWYRDHSAPFKAALEDGTVELVRDADHLDDLRAFQVVKGIPLLPDTRSKGQDGSQRHGDAGVAYLLAYAASRSESQGVTSGFESVPRRGGNDEDRDLGGRSRKNVLMPKLVDQYGRPIDQGALREPQTARVTTLQNEYLSGQLAGLSPARVAATLRQADDGDLCGRSTGCSPTWRSATRTSTPKWASASRAIL